jgi:hypothetical protein
MPALDVQAPVGTWRPCAMTNAATVAMSEAKTTAPSMNVSTARSFPASRVGRLGWRTRSCRNVPKLYSLAICVAAMPKATTPRSTAARLTPWMRPSGCASCARLGRSPPPPLTGAWAKRRTVKSDAAMASPT